MTDSLERLQSALAERYTLERRLGEGGMATVYLAPDPKHDRPPHIPPLFDSVETPLWEKSLWAP